MTVDSIPDLKTGRLMQLAVLLMLAAPGARLLFGLATNRAPIKPATTLLWEAAYVAFLLTFVLASRLRRPAFRWAAVGGQGGLVLVMVYLVCNGFEGALQLVVASQLPASLRLSRVAIFCLVQALALAIVVDVHWSLESATAIAVAWLWAQIGLILLLRAVARESALRLELAGRLGELRSTQQLLAAASASAERVRIARDLHDRVGHQLTALALNLEVAAHSVGLDVADKIRTARRAARALLADVREVVTTLRTDEGVDAAAAIRSLIEAVPAPTVHLQLKGDLRFREPARAEVLVRCVQEVVTNAMRHSDATHLWVVVSEDANGVSVRAWDDGRGVESVRFGAGLSGMQERLDQVGGTMAVESRVGSGFSLTLRVPEGAVRA